MNRAAIIRTGVSNIASVEAAFERLGCQTESITTPEAVERSDFVVLPGVGSFDPGMDRLAADGLVEPLRQRIQAGRPTLAICLGMQLLCDGSDEAPGRAGIQCLGVITKRFPTGMRVPHMGWNSVTAPAESRFVTTGDAYFAHSYYLPEAPDGWIPIRARHGASADDAIDFVAGCERDAVLALQFHPELSGEFGQSILKRWLSVEVPSC